MSDITLALMSHPAIVDALAKGATINFITVAAGSTVNIGCQFFEGGFTPAEKKVVDQPQQSGEVKVKLKTAPAAPAPAPAAPAPAAPAPAAPAPAAPAPAPAASASAAAAPAASAAQLSSNVAAALSLLSRSNDDDDD